MRASSKREKWIHRCLMIFIMYSVASRYLSAINRFSGGERYIQYLLYIEVAISVPLLIYSFSYYSNNFKKNTTQWVSISLIYLLLFELVNTFIFNSIHTYIVGDFAFWCFFFSSFFLGSSEAFWEKFFSYSLVILVFTSLVSVLELSTSSFSYIRGEWDESSYLYDVQIGFVVLHMLLAYFILSRQRRNLIILLTVFVLYVVLQFYFQKRLPLFRILLIMLSLIYITRIWFKISKAAYITLVGIVVVVISLNLIPREYYNATLDRFYERGDISETASSDSRYMIAERAISYTVEDPKALLFGQGLGGTLTGNFYGKTIHENGKEINGIAEIEVGAVTIFFRYGIVFFLILFGKMISLLRKVNLYKNNPLALSCWAYLLVFVIMSFVGESFPGSATPIHTMLVGGSLGYLSSPHAKRKSGILVTNMHAL